MRVSLWSVIAVALMCAVTPAQFASEQTLPAGFLGVTGASGGTAFPQNATTDHKWQWHYDSPQFAVQGPITICGLAVRAENGSLAVNAFNFPSFVVTMATATTDYTVAGHNPVFASNLSTDATVVRSGPWVGGPVPASGGAAADWIDIPLSTTFTYDPTVGDFIIQIEKCGTNATWGAAMDGKAGAAGVNGGNRYGDTASCTAPNSTFNNNEFVPLVRITYVVGPNQTCLPSPPGQYQVNSAVSSLDVDGAQGGQNFGAVTNACIGQTVTLNSSGMGNYEIGIAFAASIPGGLLVTPGLQVVNLDIGHPSLFFLNGNTSTSLIPHPGTFALPLTAPNILNAAGQQMVTDATHPDGFQLSQAPELFVTAGGGSSPVTLGDDNFVQMPLAGPPLCGTSVDFYGTTYTEFFVESNGPITFQMGSGDFTATAGEWQSQMPRIGINADLEPNNFGTVTVTNNGAAGIGDWITIAYSNVTEWGTGGTGVTSYNIELHGPNGHEIGGFTTDGTWGTTAVVGGITLGSAGTHPALVSFDALFGTGLQANVNATDSVIDENTAGMLINTNGWTSIQFPLFDGSAYVVQ